MNDWQETFGFVTNAGSESTNLLHRFPRKSRVCNRCRVSLRSYLSTWSVNAGSHLAVDSSAVKSYEKKQPKSKSQQTGDANWVAKYDTFANKLAWFGYKIHLAVDTASELPVALEVTPANVYDGEMAAPLLEHVVKTHGWKVKFVMMDAGYDQIKNYEAARQYGAQAIIAMNKRGEKEPPEEMASDGTPRCTMGYDMCIGVLTVTD